MCGYGYGVGDIWYYKSNYDMDADSERDGIIITKEEKDVKWGDTVNNANSVKLGYMKKFFTSFDWYELEPCFDDSNCFTIDNARTLATGAHIGVDRFLVYVYNTNTDACITVKGLQSGADYSAYWFDCNTGEYILIEKSFVFNGAYSVSKKPSGGDYVLEIVKNGTGQGFAGEENEF